jgi:nicotinic acid phosphoribosyltransferase
MRKIYTSHLDNDTYKFHMGSFFWHYYKGLPTTYAYKCRDPKINLQCIYDDLIDYLAEISEVKLQKDEQKWLFDNTKVTQDYLVNFLKNFSFDPSQVSIKKIIPALKFVSMARLKRHLYGKCLS